MLSPANPTNNYSNQVYQNISRANFHPIGVPRYGATSYSSHMRAETTCTIAPDGKSIQVLPSPIPVAASSSSSTTTNEERKKEKDNIPAKTEKETETERSVEKKAALRMFGAFVPIELKAAQREAVVLVQDIVPRIVDVDREMRELEIRIRRARKYRAREEGKSERVREVEVEVEAH